MYMYLLFTISIENVIAWSLSLNKITLNGMKTFPAHGMKNMRGRRSNGLGGVVIYDGFSSYIGHSCCNIDWSSNSKRGSHSLSSFRLYAEQQLSSSSRSTLNILLQDKIALLQSDENVNDSNENETIKSEIQAIIKEMEDLYSKENTNYSDDDDSDSFASLERFQPALGLYNVTHVQTKLNNDNPVGGKWTRKNKLFSKLIVVKRTMQHLLPVNMTKLGQVQINCTAATGTADATNIQEVNENNVRPVVAEAVNVITLEALWNIIHLNIILRGDAVPLTLHERNLSRMKGGEGQGDSDCRPLTNLAVKAYFDKPKIIIRGKKKGWALNLCLGPKSSVVLDTTYLDRELRIGKGGTSGTRFVFKRCDDGDIEAEEFKSLLLNKSTGKGKLLSILLFVAGTAGLAGNQFRSSKIVVRSISLVSSLLFLGVLCSTGGIEQDSTTSKSSNRLKS